MATPAPTALATAETSVSPAAEEGQICYPAGTLGFPQTDCVAGLECVEATAGTKAGESRCLKKGAAPVVPTPARSNVRKFPISLVKVPFDLERIPVANIALE